MFKLKRIFTTAFILILVIIAYSFQSITNKITTYSCKINKQWTDTITGDRSASLVMYYSKFTTNLAPFKDAKLTPSNCKTHILGVERFYTTSSYNPNAGKIQVVILKLDTDSVPVFFQANSGSYIEEMADGTVKALSNDGTQTIVLKSTAKNKYRVEKLVFFNEFNGTRYTHLYNYPVKKK